MYLKVEISAETQEQADAISRALLDERLITGGQIIAAPARFLWKGSITDMDYFMVTGYTTSDHKESIIKKAESISIEEVPMITFMQMEVNPKLAEWIDVTLASNSSAF